MLNEDLKLDEVKKATERSLRASSVTIQTLGTGEIVYRFANRDDERRPGGVSPWWIREKDYKLILRHQREGKSSLGLVGRIALAVKQVWWDEDGRPCRNRMDCLIQAQAVQDVRVAAGRAKTQFGERAPNGIYLKWPGDPEIEQLYIPNLESGADVLTIGGRPALRIIQRRAIESTQLY